MKYIFRLQGIPKLMIFDRDAKFTSNFYKALFEVLEIQLKFSTMYHPKTNGQTERTNQVLEDM